jgi:hypothetical protein
VVESLGWTRLLPVFCTVPIPWLIETLLTLPETSQRKVDDWPRWMVLGSAEKEVIVGAAGGGGAGAGAGAGAGGGGGAGAFFLQPAANKASVMARAIPVIFRLLNMNICLLKLCFHFPQAGL